MKNFKFALLACLTMAASSCSLPAVLRPHKPTPAEQVATLLAEHPDLVAKQETITVTFTKVVPEIHFEKELVPIRDTIYLQREAGQLDTLVSELQSRLDSAHLVAARAKLQALLLSRPVLHDTLHFDTLGVRGRIWRTGTSYRLNLVRAAIPDTGRGRALVPHLVALPPKHYPFYNPVGWPLPWWAWLLIGVLIGLLLTRRR